MLPDKIKRGGFLFTGIIEEIGKVVSAAADELTIAASKVTAGMETGASIAVNGACLTVTDFKQNSFALKVMPETLRRTNLGQLTSGDMVNLERALPLGGRLGGHLVEGHVDNVGRVASITSEGEARLISFYAPPEVMGYLVEKGFIAVDGVSLTIVNKNSGSFGVSVVDYTLKNTNLGSRRIGDTVNLEVDIVAKYVKQFSQAEKQGITIDFLEEHGFVAT
jgi:riboflavin synthase